MAFTSKEIPDLKDENRMFEEWRRVLDAMPYPELAEYNQIMKSIMNNMYIATGPMYEIPHQTKLSQQLIDNNEDF